MSDQEIKLNNVISEDKLAELTKSKKIKELSDGSKWDIFQKLFQEVQSANIISCGGDKEKLPNIKEQYAQFKEHIAFSYKDDEDTCKFLLENIPQYHTVLRWIKKKDWEDSVMAVVQDSHIFSPAKKTALYDALYSQALFKGNIKAIELYFKLSGDLNKQENKPSKELDEYRKLNEVLHSTKK
jgi:hypothetical protein